MNNAILDFETRQANPAGLQDKLDAIIQGYSSTFDESVPSMARSMKAKLALTANAKYAFITVLLSQKAARRQQIKLDGQQVTSIRCF